jgi:RluA family pseudouridine synthase
MQSNYVNISAYLFTPLFDLKGIRESLIQQCDAMALKGTILLSTEGINLFVSGREEAVQSLVAFLKKIPGLETLKPKESLSSHQPFNRMLVKIKKEIIAFGVEGIDPARKPAPKISPQVLKKWLDEKRQLTLLDTRNDYEVKLGTFKNAVIPHINHFRDFPKFVETLPEQLKNEPVVMFCTGGIRCEKAGPLMEKMGFRNVFQLEGGILKYFEEIGSAHYEGDCFVFDARVGVDPSLSETPHKLCFSCLSPLTVEDQQRQETIAGKSCPYCFERPEELMQESLKIRHEAIAQLKSSLPGDKPYQQRRPIRVPQVLNGTTLLDCVSSILKHIDRDLWGQELEKGLFETEEGKKVSADHLVKAGERYFHLLPQASEPAVNADIKICYEDEALFVVEKPAPLPVHPSGRFQRNTLQYILTRVYEPQVPKPVHRLDANTTGLLLVARNKRFAAFLQKQFEQKSIEKVYWAKIHGHPPEDRFECNFPIAEEPGEVGCRLIDEKSGLEAQTQFKVIERNKDGTSLVEVRPITGRTNQIRVHLWALGFPICGDQLYLADKQLGHTQTRPIEDQPLCLHAKTLKFTHPVTKKSIQIESKHIPWLGSFRASIP